LHFPELKYCGDNAAMVAAAAFFTNPIEDAINIQANPNLSL
jgi:tRNA A37 threonylcarbamoyltransferase TsaD